MLIKKFDENSIYNENGFKYVRFITNRDINLNKEAQEIAFNCGYIWKTGHSDFRYLDSTFELIFNTQTKRISYSDKKLDNVEIKQSLESDYIIIDNLNGLELYLKTDGKGYNYNMLYNKKTSNIYENNKTVDLIVFEANSDDDVIKAQNYGFENGYTWYGGFTRLVYKKIDNSCKYFFYEVENKKVTVAPDLEDKTPDEYMNEYYNTDKFIVINDIKRLEQNLKTNGKTFYNYYNDKKLVYENIQNEDLKFIIFNPKTPEDCEEIQEYAFEYGWKWSSGDNFVMNTDSEFLFFNTKEKKITYTNVNISLEDMILGVNHSDGTNDINKMRYFLKTNVFPNTLFNSIYNTDKNVYEGVQGEKLKFVVFEPESKEEFMEIQKHAFECGWCWSNGVQQVMNYNAKFLTFNIDRKKLTYTGLHTDETLKDKINNNSYTDGTDDINIIKRFLSSNRFVDLTFDDIYNKNKNIYENNQNEDLKYIVFKPISEDKCEEIQEYAFECGWKWSSGDIIVMNTEAETLLFDTNNKSMYFSRIPSSIEKIIKLYKEQYNHNVDGTDDINTIKQFLRTNRFTNTKFNAVYNNRRENTYESIKIKN